MRGENRVKAFRQMCVIKNFVLDLSLSLSLNLRAFATLSLVQSP